MRARGATAPHRVVSQAKALLMAGDGVADSRIATALGISRPTVGLYLKPPDQAVVLCVDEKSQIQALDRTDEAGPLRHQECPDRAPERHDAVRWCRLGSTDSAEEPEIVVARAIGASNDEKPIP